MGLAKLFNIERVDSLLNLLIITPLLHHVQMDWTKFSIIALIVSVILVIKEILIILATYSKNKSSRNKSKNLLWRFINSLIVVPMTYLQYKYESFTKYNKWLIGLNVFYNLVKFFMSSNKKSRKTKKNIFNYPRKKTTTKKIKVKCGKIKNKLSKKKINYFLRTYDIKQN